MIIEGLITCSQGTATTTHVAALGPVVDPELTQWTLRPFQTSRIFALLRSQPKCVFHVIDDPLPVVQLVLGQTPQLSFQPVGEHCYRIEQACSWYQLEIHSWKLDDLRSEAQAHCVAQGHLRPFWGWNRAKHALLEAAILISRAGLLPLPEIDQQLHALAVPIEKTAGPRELQAWHLVQEWRQSQYAQARGPTGTP